MDFHNFYTIYVLEVNESTANIPTELPCLSDLENPCQLRVRKVLMILSYKLFKVSDYSCFRGQGIHCRYFYTATLFELPRKSRSTSGSRVPRRYWWLYLMDFHNFFTIYVFEVNEFIVDILTSAMISSQSVPLLAILASSLTLTCLSLIKSTLYPNLVIFISETSVEFVIFFLFLQPRLLQIHLFPANLTIAIHFTLASHKQISTNFNAFKIHWHVSLQILQNINTSHQHSKNYTGFLSNKESTTKPVFSHTKHLQINNLHIFTIVFHSRHILFLHDLLIRLFFPFHMSDHHLAKGLSLSSVHASGIHSPPLDTRNSSSLPIFRSRLKTHLFKIAFPP